MKTTMLLSVLLTMMSSAVIAADDESPMSLDDAQQATGETTEKVLTADANGDGLIDATEFAALTAVPEEK